MSSSQILSVIKWRDLVLNLVIKEMKIRYMGAMLGFVWSLGNPLVVTLTYYVVFTYIMPNNQDRFALHLVTGVVHWMLLAQALSQSSEWLIGNSNLIRKMRFPRILLPLSCAITLLVLWAGAMLIYAGLFIFLGGVVTRAFLWYPIILISFIALVMGAGLTLSVLQITVRDAKHFTDVCVPLLFWLTPIVWMTSSVPAPIAEVIVFNPLTPFFNGFNDILHSGIAPAASTAALCLALGATSLAIGLTVFKRLETQVEFL
jgi:lipopolysaccharide transport system permease protein